MTNSQALQTTKMDALLSPEIKNENSIQSLRIIRMQVGTWMNDAQFCYFLEYCKAEGVNPLKNEVYAVPFKKKDINGGKVDSVQFFTSINTLRKRGFEHPRFRGTEGPFFAKRNPHFDKSNPDSEEFLWVEEWLESGNPFGCKFTIFVDGNRPTTRFISWKEFNKGTPQWSAMPSHMLAKTCEAVCWRAALPPVMGNSYTDDEMGIDVNAVVTDITPTPAPIKVERPKHVPVQSEPEPETEEDVQEAQILVKEEPPKEEPSPNPEPEEKAEKVLSPEDAQREVFSKIIRDGISKHTGYANGNPKWIDVRAACSMLENPGPVGKTKPDFKEWNLQQLEALGDLYLSFDSTPYVRPEGFEGSTVPEPEEEKPSVPLTQTVQDEEPPF